MASQPYFVAERVRSGMLAGRWYDYSAGRHRLLLTNSEAPALAALVVFFIALCTKNTSIIVIRLLYLARAKLQRPSSQRVENGQTATDATPLLNTDTRSHPGLQAGYNTANGSPPESQRHQAGASVHSVPSSPHKPAPAVLVEGGRDSVMNSWLYVLERNDHWFWILGCLVVLLGTQFLVLLLGYFANPWLLSSKAAIWHSDVCGVWEFPSENTTAEEATRADVVLRRKEARAAEYAKYCYEPWSHSQPLPVYCDFFAHRDIPFEETRPHGCPFPNSSVCAGSQVVKFDTGMQPASILGINQANPYMFRKTATCVPLSVEEPYVREEKTGDDDRIFKYYYGMKVASGDPAEPLFDTSGYPFYWTVPTYDASVFTTGPEADGYWTPREDLDPGRDNTLTLLFVRPLQIYYLGPSRDALFPTDHVLQFPDGDKLHIKSDPKARVLACVEDIEFCEPSGNLCWPAHIRPDTSRDQASGL